MNKLSRMSLQPQAKQNCDRVIKQCDVEHDMKKHGASPPLWSHNYL